MKIIKLTDVEPNSVELCLTLGSQRCNTFNNDLIKFNGKGALSIQRCVHAGVLIPGMKNETARWRQVRAKFVLRSIILTSSSADNSQLKINSDSVYVPRGQPLNATWNIQFHFFLRRPIFKSSHYSGSLPKRIIPSPSASTITSSAWNMHLFSLFIP